MAIPSRYHPAFPAVSSRYRTTTVAVPFDLFACTATVAVPSSTFRRYPLDIALQLLWQYRGSTEPIIAKEPETFTKTIALRS